jgi:tRNA A37 threonylcarbamoyltransferase TsaD
LEYGGDIAVGEAKDKMVAGLGGRYKGMSNKIRKLLKKWK